MCFLVWETMFWYYSNWHGDDRWSNENPLPNFISGSVYTVFVMINRYELRNVSCLQVLISADS